jgi:hypothetical protein
LEFLKNENHFNNQIDYFNNHSKKDDLADSFLQGLWFIGKQKL